jgi:bifunctional UDP-N-acetylglucosamine pyrophosphorylase/glucosamine-1-phosphate N-acetyltransferase
MKNNIDNSLDYAEYYEKQRMENRARNLVHAARGVLFRELDSVFIDDGVLIGSGTRIEQNVSISGDSVIGEGCLLGQGSVIHNSRLGDRCEIIQGARVFGSELGEAVSVLFSVILDSNIGARTVVGPFAYVRPGSAVGEDVKVGDFVELKNSAIGDNTKISHLTYVGDADVGTDVNLGCGVVFVNYDGRDKHRSSVGNGAFIGCNVNIVSPVEIGDGAYVAAGTTVTGNVPPESLSVGRSREKIIEGWVRRRGLLRAKRRG